MSKTTITSLLFVTLVLATMPFISKATIGDNVRNAVSNASPETQAAVLDTRITAITKALNVTIEVINRTNDKFQSNEYFLEENKDATQELTEKTVAMLEAQIDKIDQADSNEEIDTIREETVEELKTYEDEMKDLIKEATTNSYERMIDEAEDLLNKMELLEKVLDKDGVDTTDFNEQINTCKDDIEASNTAFYAATDSMDTDDMKTASKAVAKLSQDLAELVKTADELAQ
ncbi:MAG: hypothetical protein WCW27_00070 [Patescibacteria group bacterium]|jgi:hypothetical protein